MVKPPLYKPGDKILDVYVVDRELGSGGFSSVYLVHHAFLPRQYAAKVMRVAAETPEDRARLASRVEREAITLARFDHPNLPTLHDLRIENGRPVLIIEYLVGKDLSQILDHVGQLAVHDALYVGIEVAKPLYIAHQRNLIHRDIKPENIFCSAEEPPEGKAVVRLLDFGAVRLVGAKRITKEGTVIGTFHYMAPEGFRGGAQPDHRADIYSLGIVLCKALAGFHPFDPNGDLDPYNMGVRHMGDPVPDIREVRPEVPSRFAAALTKMMAKLPSERFDTMQDVYDELWAILSTMHHEAEREGRALSSIFTRKGIVLPSPDVAAASRRRRASVRLEGADNAKTEEMPLLELSVAAWAREPEPEKSPAAAPAASAPLDEAFAAERLAKRLREIGEGQASPGAREVCERGLGHPSVEVRLEAAAALGKIGNALSGQALERAASSEREPEVKRRMLEAAATVLRFDDTATGYLAGPPADAAPPRVAVGARPRPPPPDSTPEEIRLFAELARKAIGAPTSEERDDALLSLQGRAPGSFRRVRLGMLVLERQEDLAMPVDDAARLRCLHALEAWGVDGVLLAVAARGLLSAPSAPVRIACAQVLQRHGDKRHEVVVSNVLRLELPATVREAAAKALFEVRRRPEKKWEEILPMPDDPLPLAPELPVVRPRGWRLRKQDLLAVALALAVVGAVILVVLFAR